MTATLASRLGVGPRELVSIVGAGGKSTTMFTLGRELAEQHQKVIVTTTTKLAASQVTEPSCWSHDPATVEAALEHGEVLFVADELAPAKITGPTPEMVDQLLAQTSVDQIIVEADGARSLLLKAPAEHEPVVPSLSTMVVVVVGADAIGKPISEVAHRPERVAALLDVEQDATLTAEDVAAVLLHPEGGLKGIPESARVVMMPTRFSYNDRDVVADLVAILIRHPMVDRVVPVPRSSVL